MVTILWLIAGVFGALVLIKLMHHSPMKLQINFWGFALIFAALIYVGFAISEVNVPWIAIESAGAVIFSLFFFLAKRRGVYFLALGWLIHPAWDTILHLFWSGSSFAPDWYSIMCISFDITVAGYLGYRAKVERIKAEVVQEALQKSGKAVSAQGVGA